MPLRNRKGASSLEDDKVNVELEHSLIASPSAEDGPMDTTTLEVGATPPTILERATVFMDSFHGRNLSDKDTNELDIWRIRCLITVAWSTGLSGALLVPLYLMAGVYLLASTLLMGSILLLTIPGLLRYWNDRQCSRIVALVSVLVMTILTTGSGGFPNGLAPGIQRIIPILVLCFGSLELGAAVTVYVMVETMVFFAVGPFPAALDDTHLMDWICAGSWMLQPVMLFCLGVSLHMAGSQTVQTLLSASEAKARFLSIVSHELRTPLHGILGSCELGLTGSSSDQWEALESCRIAAKHLRLIVEDLLLYSSSSAIRIRNEPFEVSRLYRSLKATLQQSDTTCRLVFVDPKGPMWFLGDELRLRQCFINVIGNGIKFCSEQDTITVQLQSAEPGEKEDSPWTLTFLIQDTGPGIRKEDMKRIFAPFEQAVETTQKSLAGVGLGLSIVVALLQKMGGNIRCESELGTGSCFFLTVKLQRTEDPEPSATRRSEHIPGSPSRTKPLFTTAASTTTVPPLVSEDMETKNPLFSTDPPPQPQTPLASPKPRTKTPTASAPKAEAADTTSPIVIATRNDCDLSCLLDWEGEENLFEVRTEYGSWNQVVKSIKTAEKVNVDVIVLDDSEEALRSIQTILRAEDTICSVPVIRVCNDLSAVTPSPMFDATIHIQVLPGLIRNWYRALALGAWVLVVDDVALNRKVFRKQLSRLGHRVSEASDGLESFRKAEAAGFGHDMIAMDIMVRLHPML